MNKTAIITGGSGDIGAACCRKLAECGYNIVFGYLSNKKSADALCNEIGVEKCIAVKADISVPEQAALIVSEAERRFGGVDVLVNNAAISHNGLFQDVMPEELEKITDINIKGAFFVTQEAVKLMLKNHSGSIINISSMWGETGASTEVAYSMTKAATIGFTKALAKELGPSGIRVNCITPGLIDTKMNSCYSQEDLEVVIEETPLCRIGKTEDVASAVKFLAGDESSFITGQILGVNGGYVI